MSDEDAETLRLDNLYKHLKREIDDGNHKNVSRLNELYNCLVWSQETEAIILKALEEAESKIVFY
jgi:hypothetical protein